ncbi:MAG: DUF5666 domain-containing protein, partial [Candidatus Omnitrophota bacterium]|nr:DUF5666 domain-containing protein [Candidatus Omnitrophota bacterium]
VVALVASMVVFVLPGEAASLEGRIKNIAANSLTISQEGSMLPTSVEIGQDTQFQEGAALDNLKQGDQVKVEYTEEGGRKMAVSIGRIEGQTMSDTAPKGY